MASFKSLQKGTPSPSLFPILLSNHFHGGLPFCIVTHVRLSSQDFPASEGIIHPGLSQLSFTSQYSRHQEVIIRRRVLSIKRVIEFTANITLIITEFLVPLMRGGSLIL